MAVPHGMPQDARSPKRRRRGAKQRLQYSRLKAILKLLEGKK